MRELTSCGVAIIAEGLGWLAVAVDTLKAATLLKEEAGFDETQARVIVSTFAEGMVENLAAKEDIVILKGDVTALKENAFALRREMATLATKEELATLRGDMQEMAATLRGEISKVQERLTVRLGAGIAVNVAIRLQHTNCCKHSSAHASGGYRCAHRFGSLQLLPGSGGRL